MAAKSPEPWRHYEDLLAYKDKFVELTKVTVVIKHFYFPSGKKREIPIDDIKKLFFQKQELGLINYKDWGEALNDVWWAKDGGRSTGANPTHANVVLEVGERTKKGFSVENIEEFLFHLRPLLNHSVAISDKMPFNEK